MSAEAFGWAIDQDLPTDEKFALVMIADNGGSDETRTVSAAWLAHLCAFHPERVGEVMAALQSIGLLRILRTAPGINGDVVYHVVLDYVPSGGSRAPRAPEIQPLGHVYLMKGQHGPCKIGISTNLAQRARTIAYNVGMDCRLVWSLQCRMDAARQIERDVLGQFDDRRLNGEWLNAGQDEIIAAAIEIASKYGVEP